MIKDLSLVKVRVMVFFQVMTDVKSFLEKEDLNTLGLQKVKEVFDEKYADFDEALKPLRKSELTTKIHKLDNERDTSLLGLLAHCRAFSTFPNEEKSTSAKYLLAQIQKYGKNIQTKPLQEKTGIIINLLQDFATDESVKAINNIGATEWVDSMRTSNVAFIKTHNERTEEKGAIKKGKTQQTRKELEKAFKNIIKTINALAFMNEEEPYRNLANAINEEIKRARM